MPSVTPDELLFRPFELRDDDAVKLLEQSAAQSPHPRTMSVLRFGTLVPRRYDAKASQYTKSRVLLCEHGPSGAVCGVACVGLKEVYLDGKEQLAGYLFDLRVHEDFQRLGIGTKLLHQVEAWSHQAGATLMYLSVNNHNDRAIKMYTKAHYLRTSVRKPLVRMLFCSRQRPVPSWVREASKQEAIELLERKQGGSDGSLVHLNQVFDCEFWMGSWVAVRGDSYATVSLWDGSALGGMGPLVVLFKTSTWRHPGTKLAWCLLLGGLLWAACTMECSSWTCWAGWLGLLAWQLLLGGVLGLVYFALHKFDSLKHKARLFGAVQHGPEGQALLEACCAAAANKAAAGGFLQLLCNVAEHEESRAALAAAGLGGSFTTYFMGKHLPAPGADGQFLEPARSLAMPAEAFFDPRDI